MGELAILRGDKNDEVYNRDNENIIKRLSYCCNKKPDLEIFKGEDRLTYREFWKKINDFASFYKRLRHLIGKLQLYYPFTAGLVDILPCMVF